MTIRNRPSHILTGALGEETALGFLEKKGYKLLDRNWRFGRLELDLVCERDGVIVFIEVKTRASAAFGGPLAGMTPKKTRNVALAAQAWLQEREAWERPCRFDIIGLTRSGVEFIVEHYVNAIELSRAVDSGDAAGEYW